MSVSTAAQGTEYYRNMQVQTASPGKLVWLMLDGAARFAGKARAAAEVGDVETAHRFIVKVQDIVDELDGALDMRAGEPARALERVYAFARSRLVEANLRKDNELLSVLQRMFEELRAAWEEVMKEVPQPVKS